MFLTACGDSGAGGAGAGGGAQQAGEGAEDGQIEAAIRAVAFSDKPTKCAETMTQGFLEQSTKKTGKAALKSCKAEAGDATNDPKSVAISKIVVRGSRASADAGFTGGGFNGQTMSIALIRDGDRWKVDQLTGFAELDKAALAETYGEQLEGGGLKPEQVKCIVRGLETAPAAEIEKLMLGRSSTPFVEFAERCA
jgi:hypothetical protein